MLSKFIKLLSQETKFSFKFAAILLFVFVVTFLFIKQNQSLAQLKTMKTGKELIKEIPRLEKEIRVQTQLNMLNAMERSKGKKGGQLILKGILKEEGGYHALIGDDFYKEGDTFGDLDIVEITMNTVVLQDRISKTTKKLILP